MKNSKSYTDLAKLEMCEYTFTNARSKPEINQVLLNFGLTNEVFDAGSNLHALASKAFDKANVARKTCSASYEVYLQKSRKLESLFLSDCRKAGIAFFNDPMAINDLELGQSLQQNRLKQFDMAKSFYTELAAKPQLLETLLKFGITSEDIAQRLEAVAETHAARTSYLTEKGISQNATLAKREAMRNLTKWMTKFYAMARNAFKQEPQMMEAFGKVVKN